MRPKAIDYGAWTVPRHDARAHSGRRQTQSPFHLPCGGLVVAFLFRRGRLGPVAGPSIARPLAPQMGGRLDTDEMQIRPVSPISRDGTNLEIAVNPRADEARVALRLEMGRRQIARPTSPAIGRLPKNHSPSGVVARQDQSAVCGKVHRAADAVASSDKAGIASTAEVESSSSAGRRTIGPCQCRHC